MPFSTDSKIRQCQFSVDSLDIGCRIDSVGYVGDVAVFEAANHVSDSVGLADIGEELIA